MKVPLRMDNPEIQDTLETKHKMKRKKKPTTHKTKKMSNMGLTKKQVLVKGKQFLSYYWALLNYDHRSKIFKTTNQMKLLKCL